MGNWIELNRWRGSSKFIGRMRMASEVSGLRGLVVQSIPQTGVPDGDDEPSALPHDRGHDDPQSVAGNATIISRRGHKFSRHFGRPPDRLGIDEVRAYQLHLTSQRVAWASLNQTVCALRFFYGVTLGGWGAARCRR